MRLLFPTAVLLFCLCPLTQATNIDQRIQQEQESSENNFSLIPHKPNYLLPFNYNDKIQSYDVYDDIVSSDEIQPYEVKFQISFKTPLLTDIANLPLSLFAGYTQVSYWQAYNSDYSSPFRETNYEPELFAAWKQDIKLTEDWKFKLATLNFTHQSNGASEPLSRSWNRIESRLIFENHDLAVSLTSWYRIQESSSEDDNPDLLDYYGHGKINAVYTANDNTISVTSRNNLESGFNKGSVELNWSFPIGGKVRGYLQRFSGYGNSLIEYNKYTNTIGLGVSLTDWL